MNFWQTLPRPFFTLAPMLDVTDLAFRSMFVKYSRRGRAGHPPHVFFTEFVSADGLFSVGREHLLPMLAYDEAERPIVAQLFSADPNHMYRAAALCRERGFDGIDINMGCPERNILKQGAGAALIAEPDQAREIIAATIEGAGGLPVSVKTRSGLKKREVEKWISALVSTDISALILHARTQREMSCVPAEWDDIGMMMEIIRHSGKDIVGIGNGDIGSMREARERAEIYKTDGIMVARGIYGNPWFFDEEKGEISPREKIEVLAEHIELFGRVCPHKNFAVMKKHFKAYLSGFLGAKELRIQMMGTKSGEEAIEILRKN